MNIKTRAGWRPHRVESKHLRRRKQELLSTLEVQARLQKLSVILSRELELVELDRRSRRRFSPN